MAGLSTGRSSSSLPSFLRARSAGVSGGSLAAVATAAGDIEGVLKAVDRASWPGCPKRLEEELEVWMTTLPCGKSPTFGSWGACHGLEDFCVLAYNREKKAPVLFSKFNTPDVSVAAAVACAAAWPGASLTLADVDGVQHCDLEFFLSPLEVHRHLLPPRCLVIRGSSPKLPSARVADHHSAFMDELSKPVLGGFLACIPGPLMLDGVLRTGRPSRLVPKGSPFCWLWIFIACYISLTLFPGKIDRVAGNTAYVSASASKSKKRRRAREMRETTIGRKL